MKIMGIFSLAFLIMCSTGCHIISYSYPDEYTTRPYIPKRKDILYYQIFQVPQISLGDSYAKLHESFKNNGIFAQNIQVEQPPEKGIFVQVTTQSQNMSTSSLVWGYISLAMTLQILPAYSGTGGFNVKFHVFIDGKEMRCYEYPIRRRIFAWLPMIALLWVNLITDYETDAFSAVTNKFFVEADKDGTFNQPSIASENLLAPQTP